VDTQGHRVDKPDIKSVLSRKAKIKHFRPRDLMAATGLEASPETVDRVRKNPDYPAILSALSSADAESPPIILTEGPEGTYHVLTGKKYIVAHFDLDKERSKALIIEGEDSAAVQTFLNRHASTTQISPEDEEILIRAAHWDD
jgi:hypothetical protein